MLVERSRALPSCPPLTLEQRWQRAGARSYVTCFCWVGQIPRSASFCFARRSRRQFRGRLQSREWTGFGRPPFRGANNAKITKAGQEGVASPICLWSFPRHVADVEAIDVQLEAGSESARRIAILESCQWRLQWKRRSCMGSSLEMGAGSPALVSLGRH